jgi:hypothetical protein
MKLIILVNLDGVNYLLFKKSKGPHGEIQGMLVVANHELAIDPSTFIFISSNIGLMQLSQLIITF